MIEYPFLVRRTWIPVTRRSPQLHGKPDAPSSPPSVHALGRIRAADTHTQTTSDRPGHPTACHTLHVNRQASSIGRRGRVAHQPSLDVQRRPNRRRRCHEVAQRGIMSRSDAAVPTIHPADRNPMPADARTSRGERAARLASDVAQAVTKHRATHGLGSPNSSPATTPTSVATAGTRAGTRIPNDLQGACASSCLAGNVAHPAGRASPRGRCLDVAETAIATRHLP